MNEHRTGDADRREATATTLSQAKEVALESRKVAVDLKEIAVTAKEAMVAAKETVNEEKMVVQTAASYLTVEKARRVNVAITLVALIAVSLAFVIGLISYDSVEARSQLQSERTVNRYLLCRNLYEDKITSGKPLLIDPLCSDFDLAQPGIPPAGKALPGLIRGVDAVQYLLWLPLITMLMGVIAFVVFWMKTNRDKRDLSAANARIAVLLKEQTDAARGKVISKIEESHAQSMEIQQGIAVAVGTKTIQKHEGKDDPRIARQDNY